MIDGLNVPIHRPSDVPVWMKDLCATVDKVMSGDRFERIIEAQARKAEAGNLAASVFMTELFVQTRKIAAMAASPSIPTTATEVIGRQSLDEVEFDLLCRLEDAGGSLTFADLTEGLDQPEQSFVLEELAKALAGRGLITIRGDANERKYRITIAGSAALKSEK